MEERKKINLSAIMNSSKKSTTEQKVEEVPENNKDGPNNSAIKEENIPIKNNTMSSLKDDSNNSEEISFKDQFEKTEKEAKENVEVLEEKTETETTETLDKKEEDFESLLDKKDTTNIVENNKEDLEEKSDKKEVDSTNNISEKETSSQKISMGSIKKKEEKEEPKKEEDSKVETSKKENKKDDNKELFSNYKTDYKKEKVSIVQQIKKLKNLPKTRYKSLLGLVTVTALLIWWLFYLDPGTHSIQNYKASIFNMLYQDAIEQKRLEIEEEYAQLQEELRRKIEYVKVSWFNFTVEYRSLDWVKTYKYKNVEYSSRVDLIKMLESEINNITKEKIKDALINSFK